MATALLAVGLWLPQLGSSFWLDETITYWIVSDGFGDALHRAATYQGSGPGSFALEWPLAALMGPNEIVLRIPSLIAMVATALVVARIGALLFDDRTGRIAALVFVALAPVAWAAGDARPYAMSTLLVAASSYALLRWMRSGRPGHRVAYVLLSAATFYFNYYAAVALAAPAFYGFRRAEHRRAMAINWVAIFVLMLPLAPHLAYLPTLTDIIGLPLTLPPRWITGVLPVEMIGTVAIGVAIAAWRARRHGDELDRSVVPDRYDIALVVGWWLAAPVIFVAITLVADTPALAPRYLVSSMPGLALSFGFAVGRSVGSEKNHYVVVAVAISAAFTSFTLVHRTDAWVVEDWRGAAASIRATGHDRATPVLVNAGLIESASPDLLQDPQRADYLTPVFAPYPVGGVIHGLPYAITARVESQLLAIAARAHLETEDDFFVVVRRPNVGILRWFRDMYACDRDFEYLVSDGSIRVAYYEQSENTQSEC